MKLILPSSLALLLGAAAAVACSSGQPDDRSVNAAWACRSVAIPNGSTVECTSATSQALEQTPYTCPLDQPTPETGCPPLGSEPTPAPTQPTPAEEPSSDEGGCVDDGDDGDVADEEGMDASPGADGEPDAGAPRTRGNGNGNGHAKDDGNKGKKPSKKGCTCSNGPSAPRPDAGAGGPTTDAGPGTFKCSASGGKRTCTKSPTCGAGSHPAPCGACVPDGTAGDCRAPVEGGCWMTGGGFVVDGDGKDSFGGNAMGMKAGDVRGSWQHQDHGTARKAHGHVRYLSCRVVPGPGPGNPGGKNKGFAVNQARFGGPARWFENGAWASGFWFDAVAEDHGEPGRLDRYTFEVRKLDASGNAGPVLYRTTGELVGGNIQLHPANGGHPTVASAPPPWVKP